VPVTVVLVGLGLALGAVRAVALGVHQHRLYSSSVLFESMLRLVGGGALVLTYQTAGAALTGFLLASAAALVIFGVVIWRRLAATDRHWTEADDVSRFMARALAFSAVAAGLQNVDMIAAKMRLDAVGAGDYAVALAIARGFLLVAGPFAAIALSRPAVQATGSRWTRMMAAPIATYGLLSAPAVALFFAAPAAILTVLFGRYTPAQAQLVPLLALGFAVAGGFLILAHGEIRAGRFGFLAPAGVTLAAETLVLYLVPASAVSVGWIVLAAHTLAVGCVLFTPLLFARLRRFEGSAKYWDARYARGGASGDGSAGKFAAFKAEVLNQFVERHGVRSVIELGSGDGQQLALATYPSYLGFDVSSEAVKRCRIRFAGDDSKSFLTLAEYAGQRADLTLSLDVIYHLVEDAVFARHMQLLFDASRQWVIVYASNHDDTDRAEAAHVRHRQFTRWVEINRPDWVLRETIPNRYPYTGDFRLGSFADFFIFERA
jgi:SAM-dependent methyltransferase